VFFSINFSFFDMFLLLKNLCSIKYGLLASYCKILIKHFFPRGLVLFNQDLAIRS
jgi:hypothetical protein